MSYISYLLAAHSEKTGVYKVKQGSIPKPALLCRDYRMLGNPSVFFNREPITVNVNGY
ncbi:MAG: hypothetical protein JRG74_14540 [Deltaproteobacteria bacterium]|nr:hypothetical protein [Deltaproteobacteria bacterium]